MNKKPNKEFFVVQFLERPYAYLDEFIYVPINDAININEKDFTVFTYPIDPGMKNKIYYDRWPYFWGKLRSLEVTAQRARAICKDLNSRKPDDEDRDLNDPVDNTADLKKNAKKRKATTARTTTKKKTKLGESTKPQEIKALDDDDMLTPEFMKTLSKELELYEEEHKELKEAQEKISQKSCLLKEFIEKLKSYNNEQNIVDDKYQKLVEIIKEKEKQINELKLQLKGEGKKGTEVANDKVNSVTRWTLRYPEETDDSFELLSDSGVYVNGVAFNYIVRAAKTMTDLARMLLHEVFTDKALNTCNFNSLDSNAINTLVECVRFIRRPNGVGFYNVAKENIIRSIKTRLYYINKIPA
ncbi:uncharacterized protein LOC123720222 [Pieris brassicae]|uniref:uncharacterized protein LOC123720222 n=1 Tax=Pieris brassicae TaxID=7116 RepID=UPI001E65ECB3|nr:uncharacterized protein LOC123720222 [Pieris brassicae]